MFAVVLTELTKLKRSLVILLCVAAPSMVATLACIMLMDHQRGTEDWSRFAIGSAGLWSFFMLPMTVTALTVLVAQVEHGPRFWNHLFALPVPRWQFFAAKALIVALLVALMSLALLLLIPAAGHIAEALASGTQLRGSYPWHLTFRTLATMFLGSLLLIALQLWAALRFRSFVPPLVLGIGGTFVSVAATGSKQGAFFPWLIPTNALAADPVRAELAISIGFYGGLIAGALMLIDLGRREIP